MFAEINRNGVLVLLFGQVGEHELPGIPRVPQSEDRTESEQPGYNLRQYEFFLRFY